MNQKPTLAKRIRNFLDGKGFYLVVLLCISAVGLSGWYLTRTANPKDVDPPVSSVSAADPSASQQVSGSAQITVPTPKTENALTASTPSPIPVIEPETPAEPVVEPEKTESDPVPLVYTWPVKGDVLMAYSMETLLYDETMGDWRVHTGLDIAAGPGANVFAAAAGSGVHDQPDAALLVLVELPEVVAAAERAEAQAEHVVVDPAAVLSVAGEVARGHLGRHAVRGLAHAHSGGDLRLGDAVELRQVDALLLKFSREHAAADVDAYQVRNDFVGDGHRRTDHAARAGVAVGHDADLCAFH